jgi:hypothetical protein
MVGLFIQNRTYKTGNCGKIFVLVHPPTCPPSGGGRDWEGRRVRIGASGTLVDPGIRDFPGPVNDYQIFNPFLWLGGG